MSRIIHFPSWWLKALTVAALVAAALAGALAHSIPSALAAPVTYYIDCQSGNDANDGLSTSTPWRTFANVNSRTLGPGDSVLLKRGTLCVGIGSLVPKGSGTSASPITIGAYGTGALPHIDCGTATGAWGCVFVLNYEGYVIRDLEVSGTKVDTWDGPSGIYLESSVSKKSYFRLYNVIAHDVWYGISIGAYKYGNGGALYNRSLGNNTGYLDDVVLDGVEAYNNGGNSGNGGKGIEVNGNYVGGGFDPSFPINTNITIRNANLHDNQGDGVVFTGTDGGLMEYISANHNGFLADDRYGIWPWNAKNVTTQFSEAAFNDTATNKGGGGFDCDYNVVNCVFQYSYAHDNKGPGILFIGYGKTNTLSQSNARYNLFVDNCWHPSNPDCGDLVVFGTVFDSYYHNNTIYYRNPNNNPNKVAAVFMGTWGKFGNPSNFHFKNNLLYLDNNARAYYQEVNGTYFFDYNLIHATSGNPRIFWGAEYSSLAAFQAATGQETHSKSDNPLLAAPGGRNTTDYLIASNSPAVNCGVDLGASLMGTRDYFGNALPQGGAYDIGFHETSGTGACSGGPAPTNTPGPTATATATRTNTPVPTNTPGGPTNTPTRTNTPVPPTNTPTRTNTPAPTATPGGSTVMHVEDIWTTDSAGAPKTVFNLSETVYWHVKIFDQSNNPVGSAAVTTHTTKSDGTGFDNLVNTGADGIAHFNQKIGPSNPTGLWTISVVNVVKSGATYNPSANVKTSTTYTIQ